MTPLQQKLRGMEPAALEDAIHRTRRIISSGTYTHLHIAIVTAIEREIAGRVEVDLLERIAALEEAAPTPPDDTRPTIDGYRIQQLGQQADNLSDLVTAAREYLEAADAFVDTTAADEGLRAERIMEGKRANFEQALSATREK